MEKWIKQYKLGRIRQIAIWISVTLTSWKSESSNVSLVVLDKVLLVTLSSWRSESSNLSLVVLDKLIWKKFQRKVLTEIPYSYWILGCDLDFSYSNFLEKWIKKYKLGHIRQVAICISVAPTSWKSESSNVSLVVLDKLLFGFQLP